MYEELVKRLRTECTLPYATLKLIHEAADAIEKLQRIAENYKGWADDFYKDACDYKAMIPHWISAAERLPESYTWVLVSSEEYKEAFVAFYDGTQWKYASLNDLAVTHWMPLPEPPEEET